MLDSIERDIYIAAPVDRVWELITQPEHLGRWFSDSGAEVDLRPGGHMSLTWQKQGTMLARVDEVEEPHRFVWSWAIDKDEPRPGRETRVEFTLASEDDGTRMRVVESGFASLDEPDAEREARYADHVEGWGIELGHLEAHASGAEAALR